MIASPIEQIFNQVLADKRKVHRVWVVGEVEVPQGYGFFANVRLVSFSLCPMSLDSFPSWPNNASVSQICKS